MKHLEEVIINYDKKLMEANAEIERLNNIINELSKENQELNNGLKDIKWYIEKGKTSFSDLFIPASDVVSILVIINRLLGSDKE